MRSPSPGRNKAQAPPVTGPDLGSSDVSWRRGDRGYRAATAFSLPSFAAAVVAAAAVEVEAAALPGAVAAAAAGAGVEPEVAAVAAAAAAVLVGPGVAAAAVLAAEAGVGPEVAVAAAAAAGVAPAAAAPEAVPEVLPRVVPETVPGVGPWMVPEAVPGEGRRGRRAGAVGVLLSAAAAAPASIPWRRGIEAPSRALQPLESPEWLVSQAGPPGGIVPVEPEKLAGHRVVPAPIWSEPRVAPGPVGAKHLV